MSFNLLSSLQRMPSKVALLACLKILLSLHSLQSQLTPRAARAPQVQTTILVLPQRLLMAKTSSNWPLLHPTLKGLEITRPTWSSSTSKSLKSKRRSLSALSSEEFEDTFKLELSEKLENSSKDFSLSSETQLKEPRCPIR